MVNASPNVASDLQHALCPLRIAMLNQVCVTGAQFLGDQVLLDAIPMEDVDLVLEPARQRVVLRRRLKENPRHAAPFPHHDPCCGAVGSILRAFMTNRSPTPGSVMMYRGSDASSPSLWRSLPTRMRR